MSAEEHSPISVLGQPLLSTSFWDTNTSTLYNPATYLSGGHMLVRRYSSWHATYLQHRSVGNKPHFIMRQLLLGQMTSDQIRTPLSFPVVDQTWHSEAPRMPVISTNPKTVHSTSVSAPINWATPIHHLIWKFARFSIKLVFKVNDRKQGVCEIGESLLPRFIHLGTNQLFPVMFQLSDAFHCSKTFWWFYSNCH